MSFYDNLEKSNPTSAKYFKDTGITIEDIILRLFTEDDLNNFPGQPQEQWAVKIAIRRILADREAFRQGVLASTTAPFTPPPVSPVLDLSGMLVPSVFSGGMGSKLRISDFVATFTPRPNEGLQRIDLSNCWLIDEDLQYVNALVRKVLDANPVGSHIGRMILKGNRVIGASSAAKEELRKITVNCFFVDVTTNPFASVDRKDDFFNNTGLYNNSMVHRLVWIPAPWLSGTGWKSLIDGRLGELVDQEPIDQVIIKTHEKYYSPR
jgi:hypothetical protein